MSNRFFPDPKRTCSSCGDRIDMRSVGICRPCFWRAKHSKSKGYGGAEHIRNLHAAWKRRVSRA